ncbi:MAG: CPBP family intramembrane glutamic endopeptidase [Polaromonas sp.]
MLYWAADLVQFALVPLLLFLFLRSVSIRPSAYGFRSLTSSLSGVEAIAVVLFVAFVYWVAYEPVRNIAYRFLWQYAGTFNHKDALPETPVLRLIVVIYLATSAALIEEAVFRGLSWLYVGQYKRSPFSVPSFAVITSLLFAAIHYEQGPHAMIAALSVGIVAAMLYAKIQNIWPFLIAHFLIDIRSYL